MASITTLTGSDGVTTANSMTKINTNFTNLNSDKIETSYLDTDTSLTANSDSKIATQKAVKAYVDSGGNQNASETTRGIVEEATDAEVTAGTATGSTGAKLFVTPAKLATFLGGSAKAPVYNVYTTTSTFKGDSTTQFDITNPSGTTFRYTFDGTGTDPAITGSSPAVGAGVNIQGQNFSAANKGSFVVTASGTNYFEVTNASGVAENNKTLGTGFIAIGTKWTKPTGLKYVMVEVVGSGGGGGSTPSTTGSSGGGGGGYSKKKIVAASLSSTEVATIAAGGAAATAGKWGAFGSHLQATGGGAGAAGENIGGSGGVGSSGDLNCAGSGGGIANATLGGNGGSSVLGGGATSPAYNTGVGSAGGNYGGGGSGCPAPSGNGGAGAQGVVIVTEYYV